MTEPEEVEAPEDVENESGHDPEITDENPEDAGDEEYYNTEEDDREPASEHGFGAYPRTYLILEQIIKYFPNHSHVYVTSTTGGTHATTSLHYRGEAIDVGSASQVYKDQLAAWLYKYSSHISELIHSKVGNTFGWYVKNGVRRSHSYYGSTTTRAHVNHVHFGITSVSQANAMLAAVKKDAGTAPAPQSNAPAFPGVLKRGSKGTEVKTLQNRLNARGYAHIDVDGDFGKTTEDRVRDFQKFAKIGVDGIVGKTTWAKLWSVPIS